MNKALALILVKVYTCSQMDRQTPFFAAKSINIKSNVSWMKDSINEGRMDL